MNIYIFIYSYKYICNFICQMVINPKEKNKASKEEWDMGERVTTCNFR